MVVTSPVYIPVPMIMFDWYSDAPMHPGGCSFSKGIDIYTSILPLLQREKAGMRGI